MENTAISIGDRLRYARGEKSQKEVADALGVSVMAISMLENNQRRPSYEMMLRLSKYFGIKPERLFF